MKTTVVLLVLLLCAGMVMGQQKGDIEAVGKVLDKYQETETAGDMIAQSKLMTDDRVWIGGPEGRRTNQKMNMQLQQAAMDEERKLVPGIRYFFDDRDRLLKFYGNVAIASFYRYVNVVVPASTPPEVAKYYAAPIPPEAVTLVLVKEQGEWKIVHTHASMMEIPSAR